MLALFVEFRTATGNAHKRRGNDSFLANVVIFILEIHNVIKLHEIMIFIYFLTYTTMFLPIYSQKNRTNCPSIKNRLPLPSVSHLYARRVRASPAAKQRQNDNIQRYNEPEW